MSIRSIGWALPVALMVLVAATARVWSQTTPGAGGAAAAPIPTRIAVVNISSVFDHLDERADNEKQIDTMTNDLNDRAHKMEKDLTDLSDRLKLLKPDSPDYKTAQDTLLKQATDYAAFGDYRQRKLSMEQQIRTMDLYRRINDAVGAYAQANGLALVLVADDPTMSDARTPAELMLKIANRKVIYAHPEYDITQKLILKMNADYMLRSK